MLLNALVAFAHFAAAFGVVATLVFEWLTFSRTPTLTQARQLALADRRYGISAGVLLAAGFARARYFEKGWGYYQANPFFGLKLTLFLLIGLLSIMPTACFFRWRSALKAGQAPLLAESQYRRVALSLRLQMLLLLPLLLCASLMAHGLALG